MLTLGCHPDSFPFRAFCLFQLLKQGPCLCVCSSNLYILTAHEVNDYSIQIISLNFFFFKSQRLEWASPARLSLLSGLPPGPRIPFGSCTTNWKGKLKRGIKSSGKVFFLNLFSLSFYHASTAQWALWIISVLNICLLLECFCLIAVFPQETRCCLYCADSLSLSVIPFIFLGSVGLCWSMPELWVFSSNCRLIRENGIHSKLSFFCSHLYFTPYTHVHIHPLGYFPEYRTCYLIYIFH